MSKKIKNKEWLDLHSKKLSKRKYRLRKKNKKFSSPQKSYEKQEIEFTRKISETYKDVPSKFSFLYNPVETIDFYSKMIDEIRHGVYRQYFYVNSKLVEEVTVDALIYLIAIMQNMKVNYERQYTYRGNLPRDPKIALVYQESGFMSYVKSKQKVLPASTNKMKIVSGVKNEPKITSDLCRFVMDKLGKKREEVLSLQKILIELMSNVYHHAYNLDEIMHEHWYIYAEYIDNYVRFVFVDTGAGIARTVRKNFTEKIQRFIGNEATDGDLIYSTLSGDFRTETNESHRGNGLSGVRELAESELFKNFTLISGRGQCTISNENKILIKNDYKNQIYGTIYIFDVV